MPVILPTKDDIIRINTDVIQNSTDPNEDKSDAGKIFKEGYLDSALDPYDPYENIFEAAYGIAKAIANDHVFSNGNKRTATAVVKKLFADNSFTFNGTDTELSKLVNSLVKEDGDDDEEVKESFISGITKLFS